MIQTIEVLQTESKRLRSLPDRMDALASEIGGDGKPAQPSEVARCNAPAVSTGGRNREYANLTQAEAVLKALKDHGPQTSVELFSRLNAAGFNFKRVAYITSILPRIKDRIVRGTDGKLSIADQVPA